MLSEWAGEEGCGLSSEGKRALIDGLWIENNGSNVWKVDTTCQ